MASLMKQLIRRKMSSQRRGPNARQNLGDEAEARALWRSYKSRPVHPIFIKPDGSLVDGNRRHWGAELEGDLECEVDCIVVEGDPTPIEVARLQFETALHRADISLHDKCAFMIRYRDANPGKTLKTLAEELGLDPSMPTKLLSFENLIPEAKEQVKAGKLGLRDMYAIAALPPEDQPVLMGLKLKGASADELGKHSRKRRSSTPAVRASKIKVPLVSGATVTVAGEGVSMDEALDAVQEAAKQIRSAIAKGITAKSAMGYWKDLANAS